jgi:hypothetical protein
MSEITKTKPTTEAAGQLDALVIPHFSEGIAFDGTAILKDGVPMPIEEIVSTMNTYAAALGECKAQFDWARGIRGSDGFLKGCVDKVNSALEV